MSVSVNAFCLLFYTRHPKELPQQDELYQRFIFTTSSYGYY